jgi:uncharacterized phage protein (TIGR01671 family)
MREIKFRAWDGNSKQWVHPGTVAIDGLGHALAYQDGWKEGNVDRLEISFFTGLKDKNGKQIYEGDLLRRPPSGHEPRAIFQVVWNTTQILGFALQEGAYFAGSLEAEDDGDFEIIGNIYENPTLLT